MSMGSTSLRQQLTRAAMLTTLLAILLSAGALLVYELTVYRNAGVADMRTQADLIARSTATAVEAKDTRSAWESLYLLRQQPQIRAAAVYGDDGALIASHTSQQGHQVYARVPIDSDAWGPRFHGSLLEVIQPIELNGRRVGMLYLKAEHGVWERFAAFALIVLAVSGVSLVAAYYLFVHLQRRITAPLEKMTEVARDVIGSHDWSLRAPATAYRDLDVLVDAFNRMLSECEVRTSELEREMVRREGVEQALRQADRHKDAFLATLAHELRNPLSPMTSAVALLQMPDAPAPARDKALAVLERQLQHMVRMINDLLDASRVATGKLSLSMAPLNLGDLLRTACDGALPLAQKQGLQLHVELPREALYVNGDTVRLTQVFANLLNNACRYTPDGGHVRVSLSAEGGSAMVSIADTGIGVEAGMQERIFELFEQADQTLQRGSAGLGVGLTLSRQIIQLHQGTLSMRSEGLDQGSCFTVRLPLLQGEPRPPEPETQKSTPSPLRPLHILIADDNVDLTASFAAVLSSYGHRVEVVHDGVAAMRAVRTRVPDVALLDIGMPGLDGYEVARQLRADAALRDIHVVAITGWGRDADLEAARDAGFDRHLLKPVNPEDLLRLLAELYSQPPGDVNA
ncbi:hybrid sensor histidine kinase/response regulator [Hydrogenophaga laconesensis]|uniref:histidine kinase n=1 Tax=Hydrogenophaga laconesensis TaxID=1805971 RepID=A0ABU1VHY7_9BURK|nr:ATP-binding protein [Hydrogenophaga laconesensis]MDR7097096.1 signal transduction histidine kinase/CheY-like chemotaxis protein [Hydrogenophaga laconesensis]